jgi:hypothetical protein
MKKILYGLLITSSISYAGVIKIRNAGQPDAYVPTMDSNNSSNLTVKGLKATTSTLTTVNATTVNATSLNAPGMVPIGGMVAVMPTTHANAWQPPATGVIKDGFMRADGNTVPTCADCIIPAGTTLPNMTNAFLMGSTTSSSTPTSSNTKDLNHLHTIDHTHGTDSKLGSITLAHNHSYKHTHQIMSVNGGGSSVWFRNTSDNTLTSFTFSGSVGVFSDYATSAAAPDSASRTQISNSDGSYYSAGVASGVNGDGTNANTDSKLSDYNAAHTHATNSQSTSNSGSSLSSTFDIRPAYNTTVWIIRVK